VIVGFHSPLPPAQTGVADYSAALLTELRKCGDVRIGENGDIALYHLGNNPLHRAIYQRSIERPGVVVLHDAVLNHFLLGTLDREQYITEFIYNYGAWNEDLADRLWRGRARSAAAAAYFRYPLLKRVVERAAAVLVHNRAAAGMAQDHGARRVCHIPHLFIAPPEPPPGSVRLRQQMGIGPRTFLFGLFGHLRESKRIASVLQAFRRLQGDTALLIAGEFVSYGLRAALGPLLSTDRIIRVGYTPEADFWRYAAAVDTCINLRYPPAGETSGIAIRLMGIGKPVLVTAGDETAGFPETSCLRVDSGPGEVDMLFEYMSWLMRNPAAAREIGARAAAHIAAHHSPADVAREYWRVLAEACA
jgi:glycosyltransferase involved in cell wall biosynthesis